MGSIEVDEVRRFEDKRWLERDQSLAWRHVVASELVRREPVLDVGGGDGLFLRMLIERGFRELGMVDLSPVAVEKARAANLDAECVDITQPLPFPDDRFGTVCALDVLEHLHDPLSLLREMGRIGHELVIVVPNFSYWKDRVRTLAGRVPFQCRPQRGHVYWFNYRALTTLLSEADLVVDAVRFGGFTRMRSLGDRLARARPNLFAHSFAVRARKR